ncbi:MAG: PIG-L deacetylase family protein [Acidimicrobiales bacterium]
MHLDVSDLGTILSVWAHPDDETFLAGGIMAAAAANGQRVVCVSATAGELGTSDPETWPPERLGRVRRWEAAASMAVLGLDDHRFLDLPDGGLAGLGPAGPVARLAAVVEEVRPDTILTFGPDGRTFHPDHQTLSAWMDQAWQDAGSQGRLLHSATVDEEWERWAPQLERWNVFMTGERPVPVPARELAVDLHLDGERLDRKMTALYAMASQITPSLVLVGDDTFRRLNARESYIEAPP